jgi:hypothetical protein
VARRSLPQARGILSHFARHRTLANLLLVVLVVAGIAAGTRIRSQFFPDNVVGEVSVTVAWSGAGPEEVDRAIVQVLEPTFLTLEGVEETASGRAKGRPSITISLSRAGTWPAPPMMCRPPLMPCAPARRGRGARGAARRWRDQVTDVVVSGPLPVAQLAQLADEFTARLFAAGITRTTIRASPRPGPWSRCRPPR